MSSDKGFRKDGRPRLVRAKGNDPVVGVRAPPAIIARLVATAAERQTSTSAIVREALVRYVEGDAA